MNNKLKRFIIFFIALFVLFNNININYLSAEKGYDKQDIINDNIPITNNARSVANLSTVTYRTPNQIRSYFRSHKPQYLTADYEIPFENFAKYSHLAHYDVGDQGKLTDEVLEDARNSLNIMRYIAGLDELTLDPDLGDRAQAAAYLNYLNLTLSHYPAQKEGVTDELYALQGAASSNLASGYRNLASAIISGWMEDGDPSNISRVGHRRWAINPKMGKTGFGQVGQYTAMYAFDRSNTSTSATASMWPAQNMPIQFFDSYYPWSYSTGQTENIGNVKV